MDINEIIFSTSSNKNKWFMHAWSKKGARMSEFRTDNCGEGTHKISAGNGYLLESKIDSAKIDIWPLNKANKDENARLILPGKISAIDVAKDHDFISFSIKEKLYLYQSANGRFNPLGNYHYQPIRVIKFNNTGATLACGSDDGMVTVWSLAFLTLADYGDDQSNTKPILVFSDHMLPITDMAFSGVSFRPRLTTLSEDRTVKIYSVASGELLISIVTDYALKSIALAEIGCNVYLGEVTGKILDILLWDLPDVKEHHYTADTFFEGHTGSINCLKLSTDDLRLISGSSDGTIRIWDIATHNCIQKVSAKGEVTCLAVTLLPIMAFSYRFKTVYNFKPLRSKPKKRTVSMKYTRKYLRKVNPTMYNSSKLNKFSQENVDLLRKVNKELYDYTLNKILNKYMPE